MKITKNELMKSIYLAPITLNNPSKYRKQRQELVICDDL